MKLSFLEYFQMCETNITQQNSAGQIARTAAQTTAGAVGGLLGVDAII